MLDTCLRGIRFDPRQLCSWWPAVGCCGGVAVTPGDWLVGDDDGVVVIPLARLTEAVDTASCIIEAEKRIAKAIRAGQDLGQLLRIDEILERKAKEVFVPQLRA